MKTGIILMVVLFSFTSSQSQTAFVIDDVVDPEISHFCDVKYQDGKFYFLSNHVEPVNGGSEFSQLYIYNELGELEASYSLGDIGHQYFQIYSIEEFEIILAGSVSDSLCTSTLVMTAFRTDLQQLQLISSYPFCHPDKIVRRLQLIKGLDDKVFIEGAYGYRVSTDNGNRNFLFELTPTLELNPIFTNLAYLQHFSIDFSQKGYLIKDAYVIDFYDRDFNKRKQRYNFQDGITDENDVFSYPLGRKYILDQVYKNEGQEKGAAIRLVDSNFHIKNLIVLSPPQGVPTYVELPNYGGVAVTENHIWATSNLGYTLQAGSSFISVTKLDTALNILCQQFIGWDRLYRIYGIKEVSSGGCILFGLHQPVGIPQWKGNEEVFAYRFGDECDLVSSTEADPGVSFTLTAYPNPSVNALTFDAHGLDLSVLRVEIFNSQGSILFSKKDLSYEIKVADMPPGQYFYRILEGEKLLGVGAWVKQ